MKLLIIGATGTIGNQLVQRALFDGHTVTAFARNPSKLGLAHPRLKSVAGDVMHLEALTRACHGQDAVVIGLGAGMKGGIRARGTENTIKAMHHQGIKRLICLSSLGVGDSRADLNFFWKYIMFGLLLRKAYADHQEQEQIVRKSGLDWTIVRPGAFIEGDLTGDYLHGFKPGSGKPALKISRADVAHFMLAELAQGRYINKTPGLSY